MGFSREYMLWDVAHGSIIYRVSVEVVNGMLTSVFVNPLGLNNTYVSWPYDDEPCTGVSLGSIEMKMCSDDALNALLDAVEKLLREGTVLYEQRSTESEEVVEYAWRQGKG